MKFDLRDPTASPFPSDRFTVPDFSQRTFRRVNLPTPSSLAFAAQAQIATFFATNGVTTIDPDGPLPFFETPVVLPLPEALNYIP